MYLLLDFKRVQLHTAKCYYYLESFEKKEGDMGGAMSVALEGHLDLKQYSAAQLNSTLLKAVQAGNVELVRTIITFPDVDLNYKDNNGDTPLILATLKGHTEVARVLLTDDHVKNTIRINEPGRYGRTALIWAAIWGREEITDLLLEHTDEVQINIRDEDGNTALMFSVYYEHINIFKQLLLKKAQVNITNKAGDSALTWSAYKKDFTFIYHLSLKRPQLIFNNDYIKEAYLKAVLNGDKKILPYLFSAVKIETQGVDLSRYPYIGYCVGQYRANIANVENKLLGYLKAFVEEQIKAKGNFEFSEEVQIQLKTIFSDRDLCPQWYHCRLIDEFPKFLKKTTIQLKQEMTSEIQNPPVTFVFPLSKRPSGIEMHRLRSYPQIGELTEDTMVEVPLLSPEEKTTHKLQ